VLRRIRAWLAADELEKAREAALSKDPLERLRIQEEAEGVKLDRFVMGGDGAVAPMLPVGAADELGEIFERDEHAPKDVSP